MTTYIATHGVTFGTPEQDENGKALPFTPDAHFVYDRERTGNGSVRIYSAELDAEGVKFIKALPKEVLKEYGIKPAPKDDE